MADSNLTTTINSVTIGGGGVYGLMNYIGAFHIGGGLLRYTLNQGYFANNIFNNYSGGKKGRYGYGDASDKDAEKGYVDSTTGKVFKPNGATADEKLADEQRRGDRIGDYYTTKGLPRVSTKEFMDTKTFSLLGAALRDEQRKGFTKEFPSERYDDVAEDNYKTKNYIDGSRVFGDTIKDISNATEWPHTYGVKDNSRTKDRQKALLGANKYIPFDEGSYHLPVEDKRTEDKGLDIIGFNGNIEIGQVGKIKTPEGFKEAEDNDYKFPEKDWNIKSVAKVVRNYYKNYARYIPDNVDRRPVLFEQLTAKQQTKALNFGEDIGDIVPDIGRLYLHGADNLTWINGFNYYPYGIKDMYRASAISAATQNRAAQKGPDGYYRYFPKPYSSAVKTNGDKQEIVQYSVSDNLNGNSIGIDTRGNAAIESIPDFATALIAYKYRNNGLRSATYSYYEEAENNKVPDLGSVSKSVSFNGTVINIKSGETKSPIVKKVNDYFKKGKIHSLINRFHTESVGEAVDGDFVSAKDAQFGLSRGRNLLSNKEIDFSNGYEDPYCRVWTAHKQYSTVRDLIRPFTDGGAFRHLPDLQRSLYGPNTDTRPNPGSFEYSVLQDSGFVKIAPHRDNDGNLINGPEELKKYMFSIENLAWKGLAEKDKRFLSDEQKGPHGGRIMWFPPYNLKFNENVNTTWKDNEFIGRGEKIYTYVNTERAGTLNFTLLIDHPTIINKWDKSGSEDDKEKLEQQLLRFFAGCEELEPVGGDPREKENEGKDDNENEWEKLTIEEPRYLPMEDIQFHFVVFFPNNFSGVDYKKINDYVAIMDQYETTDDESIVQITDKRYSEQILSTEENKVNRNRYKLNKTEGIEATDMVDRIAAIVPEVQDLIARTGNYNKLYSYEELKQIGKLFSGSRTPEGTDVASILGDYYDITNYEIKDIVVNGYASSDGHYNDNVRLAKNRKTTTENLVRYYFNSANDLFKDEPYKNSDGVLKVGATYEELESAYGHNTEGLLNQTEDINRLDAKIARCAVVTVNLAFKEQQPTIEEEEKEEETQPEQDKKEFVAYTVPGEYTYQNEYLYFKEIKRENNIVYKNIVDKIQYFDPAFHSITPEGFNARLNFLHQCTRQGPTIGSHSGGQSKQLQSESRTFEMAGNLAFGTAPYCILRIGDFFYSKIVITSVQIDYDTGTGIQWDLNPEGAGVQPMMANVSISFNFLGGQDITGPIAELQNAVSFNYYANSSLYEKRRSIREQN